MDAELGAGQPEGIARLVERVAELERQVAELKTRAAGPPPLRAQPLGATDHEREPVQQWKADPRPASLIPVDIPPPPLPERMVVAAPPPMRTSLARTSLEDRLGSQVFSMVGILAMIVGTSWALKLAFERGLIGPTGRVIIGLAAGIGLVLWSEMFRRKGMGAFSYALKAVGTGVLYLSLWAAFQMYHLLSGGVALTLMIVVSAWNSYMSWSQDAELLTAYALIGAFATPLLLSTGGDHEGFLFTYLAAIDGALALLMRWKPWRRLLLPAYVMTAGYFIGWYTRFFHADVRNVWDSQSGETAAFVLVFFAIFAVVSTKAWESDADAVPRAGEFIVPVLIPLGNAAFVSLALYSVFQDSGMHSSLAFLMAGLAAIYLLLMRLQSTTVAAAMHLAAAVIFLTVAIPLKASGHSLTTAWLVEGLVLYWAVTRMAAEARAPIRVLRILSLAGFLLGLISLAFHWLVFIHVTFFNSNLATALVAFGALGGAAWMIARQPGRAGAACDLAGLVIGLEFVAALLAVRELASFDAAASEHTAFANPDFFSVLVSLGLLAAIGYAAWRLADEQPEPFTGFRVIASINTVGFNLIAILSIVREIGALWPSVASDPAGEVQRSLAISGFLMLYGAALLAVGFWRRSAFVRWQALGLLVFTIAKVFLYDVSGLSQGYRVASFLSLGALLLAVSFAYQKDWLGLRGQKDEAS